MPAKSSAGILVYRVGPKGRPELLIAHMGGPFWAKKDLGAWSIPKGECDGDEEPLAVAFREFREEIGSDVPAGDPIPLGSSRQSSGKVVTIWAVAGDLDASTVTSNSFTMEWPRGSGELKEFPEVDRAEWCDPDLARSRLVKGQVIFVDRLLAALDGSAGQDEAAVSS